MADGWMVMWTLVVVKLLSLLKRKLNIVSDSRIDPTNFTFYKLSLRKNKLHLSSSLAITMNQIGFINFGQSIYNFQCVKI